MPFIKYNTAPLVTGRVLIDAATDPVTGAYVAQVDELITGDVEITANEHAAIKAAAAQLAESAQAARV